MAARITQIATALTAALNAAEFSQEFTAELRYRREKKIAELDELDVAVFRFGQSPTPEEDDSGDRGGDELEYTIEIAVRRKFKTDAEIEALVELCEEIRTFCSRLFLGAVAGDCIAGGATYDPIHDEEHLLKGVFFGLVTATFRGFEE
jgi:hypothetical protein